MTYGDVFNRIIIETQSTKADMFITYYAHVNDITITIEPTGWTDDFNNPRFTKSWVLDNSKKQMNEMLDFIDNHTALSYSFKNNSIK